MIKIEQLIPYLKDGWVAMDEDKKWSWFYKKPYPSQDIILKWGYWACDTNYSSEDVDPIFLFECFDIEPVENWRESLIEIKDGKAVRR